MSKKGPGMLDVILAAQKEKGNDVPSSKNIEDALSNVGGTISIADFKKLLAGESIETAPSTSASTVIDIAQDIKDIVENTANNAEGVEETSKDIEKLVEVQKDLAPTDEEKAEEIELFQEQNETLKQIEENTRPLQSIPDKDETPAKPENSNFLSGLLGFLGGGLAGGISGLFGGAVAGAVGGIGGALTTGIVGFIGSVFKSLIGGTAIALLVGGLINGLVDSMEEYKRSGDLTKALWEGLAGFTEFITFGLIDKETLDRIAENVKKEWERFQKSIEEFIDYITPGFMKDKVIETEHGKSIEKPMQMLAGVGEVVSQFEHNDEGIKLNGVEIKTASGDNQFTIDYNGKKMTVSEESYEKIKTYVEGGDTDKLIKAVETNMPQMENFKPSPVIGDFNVNETSQLDYDMWGNPIIAPANIETAENVIKRNEDNAWIQQNNMSNGDPTTIYAPTTTTVSSQTTVAPTIKPRNDESALQRFLNAPGFYN
jgi:hypothetical protein